MNTRTQYLDEPHGKYKRTNVVTRRLIGGFFDAVRELADMAGAGSALEVGCGEGFSTLRLRAMLPLNVAELWDRVRSLRHGRRRTFGVPAVFPAFRNQIIRRHVRALVRSVRQDFHRELADLQRRIDWRVPWLIWPMDDLERRDLGERPVFWHQTQDISSRFKFTPPVGSHLITGAAIAGHLRGLFRTYGAPLFFKRHNGGNLNSAEVNALFYEYLAIP